MTVVAICASLIAKCKTTWFSSKYADRIAYLPGQPPVSFQQYGGYIGVDDRDSRALFYYFVEAETDPSSKPLVLWFIGGPGCSSLGAGAFMEHGPFKPSSESPYYPSLYRNPFSWNTVANMLYVESPAGVGFSYSTDKSFYTSVNDSMTARDNLVFLTRWLHKFPEYWGRPLFLTGESYAGHYVPQLAQLILNCPSWDTKFNLKGIALGNPLLEFNTDFNSVSSFLWAHGVISDSSLSLLSSVCNYSRYQRESQILRRVSTSCAKVMAQVTAEIGPFIDVYGIHLDRCKSRRDPQLGALHHPIPLPRRPAMTAFPLPQSNNYQPRPEAVDVCILNKTIMYLTRKDVQTALHARLVGINNWNICSSVMHYDLKNLEIPTIGAVGSLIKSGIRVLIFSGDEDSAIPLLGTRMLVEKLANELKLETTVLYRNWFANNQVAGWTQVYANILSFATVREASHEPPHSQPERSLLLFKTFLEGKPLPDEEAIDDDNIHT
ncbi:serine carboxypeptidase-like 45 [Malania oleifera]|uniref:serine carboxypeptidase-like 45 n=1 Tax=Malania oleifera TaxID=397392 RepID=UPI0025AEC084|nr:serine carboxypeptidase-like 45 [Malania oleifera]